MSLRNNWKETGVGLGHAFRDLGKTIVKTAATGLKKADVWANGEEPVEQEQPAGEAKPAEPIE